MCGNSHRSPYRLKNTANRGGTSVAKLTEAMWVRITSLTLVFALAGSVALGAPLHSSNHGCNTPMEMSDCGHMPPSAPGVTGVQLCCLLDCTEPGSTGSVAIQIPSSRLAPVHHPARRLVFVMTKPVVQRSWQQKSSFKPPASYLKTLALLI